MKPIYNEVDLHLIFVLKIHKYTPNKEQIIDKAIGILK